ncbi:MAG: hypothetical protein IKR59_04110 [Lachnospiraceae bacterium]|nr:hypothetical protein [Lachnospiraceae bacterium]
MNKKGLSIFLIILNVLGIFCLVYLAIPLLACDRTVPNPDAMLPAERWDGCGAALCLGLPMLLAANILGMIFIAKGQIKKPVRALFLLPSVICAILVVYYLLLSFNVIPGFFFKSPVAMVSLKDHDSGRAETYTVYSGGHYSLCPEFESDPTEVYTADYNCFDAYIDDDTVRNHFVRCELTDDSDLPVEADETIEKMMRCAARELEHDIWEFKIIRDGKDLFAFVKLNVNWSDPCDLYRYDPKNDTLIHLCHWQDVDFVGIRLLQEWED